MVIQPSAITLTVSRSDIDFEREKSAQEDVQAGIPVRCFSDSYLETLAVYRKIVQALLPYDILLFHGAVVAAGHRAWVFTAPSGTGKTTHTRLWLKNIPGAYVVNGDKPLLKLTRQGYPVYTNRGVSMLPLLREKRDVLVIRRRGPERLKKYDAVLFRRDNGQYVLHRVLAVRARDYLIVGDNCREKEYVDDAHILGVLTDIQRDGRTISVTDPGYLAFVRLWCIAFPLRAALIRCREGLASLRHLTAVLLRRAGLRRDR